MQRMDSSGSDELLWVHVKKPADIKNAGVMKQIRSHTQREVRRKERISKPKCTPSDRRRPKDVDWSPGVLAERSATIRVHSLPIIGGKKEKPIKDNSSGPIALRTMIQRSLQDLAAETVWNPPIPPLALALSPKDPVRLNQHIFRYLSIWQGERAVQLCGGSVHGRWEGWMPAVLTSDTMIHAQAFCAATHFEFWGHQPTTTDTWALKDQAVMRINQNLQNPGFSQNDTNVASVLCLAFASHVENSGKENCMAHMYGLQKIIAMRGGWEKVLSNELLSDLLAMADFVSAIIFKTELTYTPIDTRVPEIPMHDPLNSPLISPCIFFNSPEQGKDLSFEAFQTLNNMQKLTATFEQICNNAVSPLFGSHRMEACFRNLQPVTAQSPVSSQSYSPTAEASPSTADTSSSSSPKKYYNSPSPKMQHNEFISDNINEAIRLAGWIYYRALIRNIAFGNEINLEDALQLRICIDATALTGWNDIPGALLWVLLVATAALRSQPEGFIVSGHLSTSTLAVGVRHWVHVRRMLEKFMLIEAMVERNSYYSVASGCSSATSAFSTTSGFSEPRSKSTSESDDIDSNGYEGENGFFK